MTGGLQSLLSSGSAQPRVAISDQSVFKSTVHPTTANASYWLQNTGQASKNATTNITGEWLLTGSVGDYDVRATVTSGSTSSGDVTGSWLNLATSRFWGVSASGSGASNSVTLLVEIRDALTLAVLDTATITITASVL